MWNKCNEQKIKEHNILNWYRWEEKGDDGRQVEHIQAEGRAFGEVLRGKEFGKVNGVNDVTRLIGLETV